MDPTLFGAFGSYAGGLAIALACHGGVTWLVVLTFYMMILARAHERIKEFVDDIQKVA